MTRMTPWLSLVAVPLLVAPVCFGADESPKGDSDYVKVEIRGKVVLARHLLFGRAAATITARGSKFWLDYGRITDAEKGRLDRAFVAKEPVVVAGELEYRDVEGESRPVVVVSSLKAAGTASP